MNKSGNLASIDAQDKETKYRFVWLGRCMLVIEERGDTDYYYLFKNVEG